MRSHKDLDVWKKSIDLVDKVYSLTRSFPKDEVYCLTNQMRRSAISIPSNISEGAARNSHKEFIQFLYIALGSLSELETQMIIAKKQNYINDIDLQIEFDNIRKMIIGLIKSVTRNASRVTANEYVRVILYHNCYPDHGHRPGERVVPSGGNCLLGLAAPARGEGDHRE